MAGRFGLLTRIVLAGWVGLAPLTALAQDSGEAKPAEVLLLPERRIELLADQDMPGGDLGPIFDTSLQSCIQACANNVQCEALTYNASARACFPKDGSGGPPVPFANALSGRILSPSAAQIAQAKARAGVAAFISEDNRREAVEMAATMAAIYPPSAEPDLASAVARAEAMGDMDTAIRLNGALTAQSDRGSDWSNLARQMLYAADSQSKYSSNTIVSAAINGYLRAENDNVAGLALRWLAGGYERQGRGPGALKALQLANQLLPNDSAILEELQKSEDRNGMRVTDTRTDTSAVSPRFCAVLSHKLDSTVNYADFMRLPAKDMAVTASNSELCVSGLAFGQQLELTLRAGLPAQDGDKLAKDVTLRTYIRDRDPALRFPGRAYVLPAGGDQGLSVATVNVDLIDLTLVRISDRNLLRTMADGMFATPLDSWEAEYFNSGQATEIWRGKAETAKPAGRDTLNTEVTTRLAIPAEAGPLEPGIYVVQASIDGKNIDDTGVATQWFVISDFGISTYSGTDGLTVAVRSLADTSAKAGAEVALISSANEVLARAPTNDQGIAHFAPGLTRGTGPSAPALITVTQWQGDGAERQAKDMAFLSLNDSEFDLSDRGVEGQAPAPAIDVFLSTDRGAYRAGDTVNATLTARDLDTLAITGLPLTAVMIRPDGVEQARMAAQDAGAGGYVVSWPLPGNAPRGTWRMEIRAEANGTALASARMLVEDFLPERIDFTPILPTEPLKAGDELPISLKARWLFGAPAAELPVEGTYWSMPRTTLEGFDNYSFGRYDDDSQPTAESLNSGETDAEGAFETMFVLPDATAMGQRPVEIKVVLNVREGAGRPVERSASVLVLPDQPIIGIRQMFDDQTVAEGTEARFSLISIGADKKPAPAQVKWVMNRVDTRYEWYSLDGQWQWEATTTREKVAEGTTDVTDTPAEIAGTVGWGQYELVAQTAQGAVSSTRFYAGWGAASGGSDTPDRLKVALDKPAYRSGETARVTVDALADGTGIVSVMSSKLVSQQIVALKAGDNAIDLPVTDEWGAGVYVSVSAIRPINQIQPGDRMPVRALGLAHAAVDPGARKLQASLIVPAEITPRQEVQIALKVEGAAAGDTVHATIAAVDQGILNLTGFTSPDPSKHYFGQRRLGVGLRDLYGRLILPSGAPDGTFREGGDAQVAGTEAPPPTEKLMSWFSGPLTVGADGTVTASIPVGDFNGQIRVMAVVWSEKGVGQTDATILSRDPVVMTVTAPAFLAPGDHAEIGLRLTHAAGPAGEMRIGLAQTGGNATLESTLPKDSVTLAEKGEAKLSVPVIAAERTGLVEMRLTLTTPAGTELTKDIAISVAMNEPEIQRQDRLAIAPGSSLGVPAALTDGLMPGASISMAIGNYGRLDVAGALARLQRYPYGCTEQITSIAMPLLYLPRLAAIEGVGTNNPNPTSIEDAVALILTRQSSSGGFGLWSADSGDLWLDSYVTDFLSRARALGHQVPDNAFKQAIDNLRNRVNYATEPRSAEPEENAALAYAVAVLARERAATIGDLRYYADTTPDAFSTPMAAANLGAALASSGDQLRADKMFRQAYALIGGAGAETRRFRSDYGTYLRDMEAVLALSAEAKSEAVDQSQLTTIVAERLAKATERGHSLSTQESVWGVLAAEGLSKSDGSVTLNGVALTAPVVDLPDPASSALANSGSKPVEVTLTATGQPITPPAAGGKGYVITRQYYSMEGEEVDPSLVQLGTRLVVVLTVRPDSAEGGRLMITDPLPAGFEIDNPNLLRAGDISSLSWLDISDPSTDMTEFRQDRFAASLSWTSDSAFQMAYILRAVTPGSFRHPAASVEDMYRPEYRAWTNGGQVAIVP
ncbi:alpha-2-macroglobulin family protein [Paracoccus sp. (in: a-proteobacteria)]|uniref:alpha-2-macroglobulin family protein n=1 Tax=Paracoccus sp. TaxID=267 RepID=UPI0028A1FAE8|nr:alpha-2-macroglobulin family protein [Paracoccus sp. (in: a-proteobacteria)]